MLWLASYIMRGRRQALLVSVLSAGVPMLFWVSAAAIGLVTLRKGLSEGMMLLLWASLPAAAMLWLGEIVPFFTLIGVTILSQLLRVTTSWQLVLLGAAALGLLLSTGLVLFGKAYIANIQELLAAIFSQLQQQAADQNVELVTPDALAISGGFGVGLSLVLLLSMLIARWWQAMLYNPGGMQKEFHALRLQPLAMTVLLLSAGVFVFLLKGLQIWAWLPMLPVFFAGLGLMHGLIAQRGLGAQWLVLLYLGVVLLPLVWEGLVVFAVADSWINFRHRLGAAGDRD